MHLLCYRGPLYKLFQSKSPLQRPLLLFPFLGGSILWMEQKGMTIDHNFCYFILIFSFLLKKRGKRKGEWCSKNRDQKSYLPVSSILWNFVLKQKMAEVRPKKFFWAITPKKELFWFIQNYTHTLWTSTNPKMQISQGAPFFNLMQHPGDQCCCMVCDIVLNTPVITHDNYAIAALSHNLCIAIPDNFTITFFGEEDINYSLTGMEILM